MNDPPRPAALLGCAAAIAAGVLTSLAFPPVGLWPLAFVGLVPLLWVLRSATAPRGALFGLCFGIGLYGVSLYWIFLFGAIAWTGLTLLLAGSAALFGWLAVLLRRPGRPILTAVATAAVWTVVDFLRGIWPFGGFTWSALGISQVANPALLPLAAVTAVWGVTFAVVLVNAAIVELGTRQGSGGRRIALVAVCAGAVLLPAALPSPVSGGPTLDIAVVQVDVRVSPGTPDAEADRIVAAHNVEVHRSLAGTTPPDLVVWGEGALEPAALADPVTMQAVRDAIVDVGAPTTAGAIVNDADGSQHTSVLAFDAQGRLVGRYDKVHLVPYGEYVPLRSRLGFIHAIEQVPIDRVPGESIHTLSQPGVPPYGTPICFENAFPAIPRAFIRDGAQFLVVPVNNASYGFTAAAAQHLQMSQMRAVETGRWVVDAGVSGISAFIDPSGGVRSRTGLFVPGILRGQIETSTAQTPYVRYGDWFLLVCVALMVMTVLVPRRRALARPAPASLPRPRRGLAVLPTYDERDTVETAIRGVLATPGIDVFVVDDSSPDGTGAIVAAIAADEPRVRLLERDAKSGLASAYLEGFRVALAEGYDIAIEMDSDLSHDPGELPSLLEAADRHDLVVGSRYIAGGSVTNWKRSRVALSRGANMYARFMLGLPIHDATSGYRVYRRALLEELLRKPFATDGYGFQIELVLRSHRLGYDVGEAPITFRDREFGESKISRSIIVEALWMVARWGYDLRFRTNPVV